jgi:tetratricopeptide (TPR) repeat protein/tRNA A-37 threonylcarbamoyl transferase component Bud32
MPPGPEPIPPPPDGDWSALKDAVKRFEDAWRQGPRPAIDDYLPPGEPLRSRALYELVHIDLELRLKAGEAARVEEYLARYPGLAGDRDAALGLIAAEHELRRRREPRLDLNEYLQRFPQYRAELPTQIPRPTVVDSEPPRRPAGPRAEEPPEVTGYEVLTLLGRGGMGVVYKARQKRLNRFVALKMLRGGVHAGPELRARFHVEAEALASLQHPNIVQIYEVDEHAGCPYIAMEFVEGGTLHDLLDGRPAAPRAAAELVETLARAMHAAHLRGIVHRDLKPANILMRRSDGPDSASRGGPVWGSGIEVARFTPKVTDFGLAKHLAEGKGQTATGVIMGTPSYMAPEQARGRVREIGPPTDVYSLGAILFEVLTGRPPFEGQSGVDTLNRVVTEEPPAPSRLRPKVPRDLETICLKCLEKDPARRYGSAEHLADDLRRYLGGEPVAARPAGPGERLVKWVRRRPTRAALYGVTAAASVLMLGTFAWSYTRILAERNQKEKSLQVARKAVDDLYTKMASERLFDEPQLDPLCQELLEKASTLYEELAREHGDNPDVRRDAALAWFRLGEIHRLRDQRREAEEAYGEAIARQEELRRTDPGEPRHRQDLANSHNWLGEVLREEGRSPEAAEGHYRAALELQGQLVADRSGDATCRMEMARSHYNLAIVERETGRPAEARADYDRAVALLTELHDSSPAEPNYRQDLARALVNRGTLHRQDGRPDAAGQDYGRAVDLLTRLHHEFPSRAAYTAELAIALQDRGNLYYSQGRQPDAQREHREALTLLRELVANFTGRPHYRKKKGIVLNNLGTVLSASGNRTEAEESWKQARAVFEELARENPEVADYQALLAMTLGNLGWLRTDEKNWAEARRLIERGVENLRAALESNPRRPEYRLELRNQYQDLGWTLVQLGDHEAAAVAAEGLAGVFPDRAQDGYYGACLIARCVPLTRDSRQALHYTNRSVALLRKAASQASPKLNRIPDEKQVFTPLAAHPDYAAILAELEAKTRK